MILSPLLLLGALGCGNVSNDIFDDDVDFAAALPEESRQTLSFSDDTTDEAGRGLGERADLVELSVAVAGGVNAYVFAVLGVVDAAIELPPSERTEDTRRWGPHTGECGVDFTLLMSRSAGVYDWSVSGHAAGTEDAVLLYGTHFAGTSVAAGDGRFVWDHSRWNEWCAGTETGLVEVAYDNRDGVDLVVGVNGWTTTSGDVEDWTYAYRRTGSLGDFQYRTVTDLEGDGSEELANVAVRDRWIPGEGGRSDATVTGGAFGEDPWVWSQCWGPTGRLLWQEDSLAITEQVGVAAACAFTDVAGVDRI
ncbi:hypothetical protein LBMAG42_14990 [Deltaproteobacteria bacterium]|nr:hypothetical protein LBMAG42_14990 [Deltaproteobacteria bacterium]